MEKAAPGGHPLDGVELTRAHKLFVAIIGLAAFFDFFDLMLAGSLTAALLASHWSTLKLNAIFLSVTGIGGVVSNLSAGVLADRYGRKAVLRGALLLVGLATLASAFAPSMKALIALRLVTSLGMAAIPATGFTMIAEMLPARMRGRWTGYASIIAQLPILASAVAAYLLLPAGHWRLMLAIPGIGCVLIFFAASVLPKSPRWLEAMGRREEADRALARLGLTPDRASDGAASSDPSLRPGTTGRSVSTTSGLGASARHRSDGERQRRQYRVSELVADDPPDPRLQHRPLARL